MVFFLLGGQDLLFCLGLVANTCGFLSARRPRFVVFWFGSVDKNFCFDVLLGSKGVESFDFFG